MLPVLSLNANSDKLFFGESGHALARYDVQRHPIFSTVNKKMRSLYWNPEEVDLSQEKASFNKMNDAEQFVFTSNLKRQILLDSIQGRAPSLVFLPSCTDSSLENAITTWAFFEGIHSESYTHIIRSIYPDPSVVFDTIPEIQPIADCATSTTAAYDAMIYNPNKENLYLALASANALEALRFYVSFACSFSFAERGMVEGSAKEIRLIARDETQHLALVQHIIKRLSKDDPEFIQIIGDLRPQAIALFDEAAEQERIWAEYIFQHGSILGLNTGILVDYVDYLLPRRKAAAGLSTSTKFEKSHPLPWVEKYLTDSAYQVAPQEAEGVAYLTSSLRNDVSDLEFTL
jgi:ribonucleoside-diphosphate reductase beta chain